MESLTPMQPGGRERSEPPGCPRSCPGATPANPGRDLRDSASFTKRSTKQFIRTALAPSKQSARNAFDSPSFRWVKAIFDPLTQILLVITLIIFCLPQPKNHTIHWKTSIAGHVIFEADVTPETWVELPAWDGTVLYKTSTICFTQVKNLHKYRQIPLDMWGWVWYYTGSASVQFRPPAETARSNNVAPGQQKGKQ